MHPFCNLFTNIGSDTTGYDGITIMLPTDQTAEKLHSFGASAPATAGIFDQSDEAPTVAALLRLPIENPFRF